MKKQIIYVFTCVTVLFLSGCKNNANTNSEQDNSLNFAQVSSESKSSSGMTEAYKDEEVKYPMEDTIIQNSNIYNTDETISIDQIEFNHLNIRVSKDIMEGLSTNDITYFDEKIDDKGRLLQKKSYVFANITITNKTDKKVVLYLSFGKFVELDSQNYIVDSSRELRYRSDYIPSDSSTKDYNRYELESNSSDTVLLGYIVNDSLLYSDNLYYMINKNGYGPRYDQFKAFKINSLKGE